MIKQINNRTMKNWFYNCQKLFDLYKTDDSLPMIIEWALYKNYIQLKMFVDEYNRNLEQLEYKYGTLQQDGTRKIDTSSNTVLEMYNNEKNELDLQIISLEIEVVNHKHFIGFKGVSLEVMSLLNFMIS